MTNEQPHLPFTDAIIASGLIAAPAWVPLLDTINQFLTTATLAVGLVLGLVRLWDYWR